jgi:YYY domain-containing protein
MRGPLRALWIAFRKSQKWQRFSSLQRALSSQPTLYDDLATVIILLAIGFEMILVFAKWDVFALAFALITLAILLIIRPQLDPARRLVVLLIAAGLAMTLLVEVIVYKGDIGRMNTVFKFYLQVWVFFAIAAAAGIAWMLPRDKERSSIKLSALWWMVCALFVFIGLLYPVFATRAKAVDRFVANSPAGLNGMDYMRTAVYSETNRQLVLEYDRQAIEWVRANIPGSPVILEGNSPLYRWGSRFSIYTGLPTIIGWDWHQKQQRSIIDSFIIDSRINIVRAIYNTRDQNQTVDLLKRYRVAYIIVGDLEHAFYDAAGLAKFDTMVNVGKLQLVYQNERVKIYATQF